MKQENMDDFSEHKDKGCFITTMTKAVTRVLWYQCHLCCNITNLGVQWSWTLTTYHNTLIITILFNNKTMYNHQLVHSRLVWPSMKKHNIFKQLKNSTLETILNANQYILTEVIILVSHQCSNRIIGSTNTL